MSGEAASAHERALPESSWIDRFTDRIAALPVPALPLYVGVALLLFAIATLIEWVVGGFPVGQLPIGLVPATIFPAGWLWLVGRFNGGARRAIQGLGAKGLRDPNRLALVERRLTTLPPFPTLLFCLGAAIASGSRVLLRPVFAEQLGLTTEPASLAVLTGMFALIAFVGAGFVLKIAVQAWRVHGILTDEVVISLIGVGRLYAFARLTATMSIGIIVSLVVFFGIVPRALVDPFAMSGVVLAFTIAALVFVLPLAGVHGRLVEEKQRLLAIAAEHVRTAADAMHAAVQGNDTPLMDPLQKALTGLEIEYRMLQQAPTWPWSAETFRWVIGALLFPVAIYLTQLAISRLTG